MENKNTLGIIDYCSFGGMLIISSAIGFYISYKGSKSPEEFLIGNRSMKALPVSMSLITSFFSAASLIGFTGETYGNGLQLAARFFPLPFAIIASTYFIFPVLYPLKLTSINEYIDLRFKSKRLRILAFFISVIYNLAHSSIALYSSTIALSQVVKLGTLPNIFILGVICTLYSSFGGIKAVVWTDVFQFSVMFIGVIAVAVVGCVQNGGFIETLHIASEGGRLEMFDMNLSPFVRHTFFNTVASGLFTFLRTYSIDQVTLQRIWSVNSLKNAKRVQMYNMWGKLFMAFLTFFVGLVAYASYAGCDPMALGIINKKDQILPYFIVDKLSLFPGLPGLFIATVVAATLSTLSSNINGCMAILWKDVCLKISFFKNASPAIATLTAKLISLVIGSVVIGIAIVASKVGGIAELYTTVSGALNSSLLGIYLIGFFLPRCNLKGVWTGFVLSTVFSLWLTIGGTLYRKPTKLLPFSAAECVSFNSSSLSISKVQENVSSTYSSITEENNNDGSSVNPLYQISYTWPTIIGPVLCILLAVVVSCITGNQRKEEVSPKYISPRVHKFYWTKEELDTIRRNEVNLDKNIAGDKKNQTENFEEINLN